LFWLPPPFCSEPADSTTVSYVDDDHDRTHVTYGCDHNLLLIRDYRLVDDRLFVDLRYMFI